VLAPLVVEEEARVVVTYTVEPLPAGGYDCPGNPPVADTFTLQRPLGDRTLLDGTCLAGKDAQVSFCERSQRWPLGG
jgi:hypothetical protein